LTEANKTRTLPGTSGRRGEKLLRICSDFVNSDHFLHYRRNKQLLYGPDGQWEMGNGQLFMVQKGNGNGRLFMVQMDYGNWTLVYGPDGRWTMKKWPASYGPDGQCTNGNHGHIATTIHNSNDTKDSNNESMDLF
jgi:hypothetical protein